MPVRERSQRGRATAGPGDRPTGLADTAATKEIVIEGTVERFDRVNPHSTSSSRTVSAPAAVTHPHQPDL